MLVMAQTMKKIKLKAQQPTAVECSLTLFISAGWEQPERISATRQNTAPESQFFFTWPETSGPM